jgi:uncharacterized protein YdaU (DUF1376 family)
LGSKKYPWFPLDVTDWPDAPAVMTDEQSGAYIRLLCWAWKEQGLPADEPSIRQIGRWNTAAWKRIWSVVGPKWEQRGERLVNPRQEIERVGAEKRQRDAKAKAAKRRDAVAHVAASATADPRQCEVQLQVHTHLQDPVRGIATLPPPRAGAFDVSRGQSAANVIGLVGAWRNVAAATPPLLADVTATVETPAVWRALKAHPDIEWWADVCAKVAASDFLCDQVGRRHRTPEPGFDDAAGEGRRLARQGIDEQMVRADV